MCKLCGSAHHRLTRRGLMAGAGAAFAAAALTSPRSWAAEPLAEGAPNAISPDAALQRIMEGNARYAANTPNQRDFSAGRAARAGAQFPIAAILSCSDSRVVPDLVFDQSPGDLFVVRLAGNFLDDDGLASLEYAVKFLGAPLLVVRRPHQLRSGRRRRQGGDGARRIARPFARADQGHRACRGRRACTASKRPRGCEHRGEREAQRQADVRGRADSLRGACR